MRFTQDSATGYVKMQSGAQNQDNVNVFIDGVSQKNYILRGGIAGMDSSRGNPFPQSAVAEYKVISQNYKAEYDQVSSAAITAVTKSGTNEFHGDAFVDHYSDSWQAESPFEKISEANGVPRPSFHQEQYGLSAGGPIIKDQVHFFVAYEGKNILQPHQVSGVTEALNEGNVTNTGLIPGLLALEGANDVKFRENLVLGKIDAQVDENQLLELTARLRRENDFTPEDANYSDSDNFHNGANDETRVDLKHTWTLGSFLNEARVGYQDSEWNPHSKSDATEVNYHYSTSNTVNNISGALIYTGGSPNAQDREQKGTSFQDDLSFTGIANHTMKMGAKVNLMKFALSGTAFSVASCDVVLDSTTGLPISDTSTVACPGTDITDAYHVTDAIPATAVDFNDTQIGLYFQDDWKATDKLTFNLGLRWDYETNMLNDDYVTPADRVTALYAADVTRYGITPAAGQTYAESLALGGVNIGDYIADGHSRKAFTGAWQPRLGFAYDFFGNDATVLFGGYGRAYDRTMANHALDELQKNQQAGGEIWLIRNDHKMPYTDQISLGLRQRLADWNGEIGYTNSYSHNQFTWFSGNRDPDGGYATQSPIDPLWGGPNGYGQLVLGDFITQAKTQTAYLKIEKPFSMESGWGVALTYTYSDGLTTNRQWTNDIFNWTYGKSGAGWNPSVDVEKHRAILTGLTNKLPWQIMLSGKLTLGSGLPFQITDCSAGWTECVFRKGDGKAFHELDLGLSKDFQIYRSSLTLRADVVNVFNSINYGGYDGWAGGPTTTPANQYGGDNANVGNPNSMGGPMRTFKLGLSAHL
ncbi:MAG: TonB-dependent receptor [Steroidobacteraceae bacterium]